MRYIPFLLLTVLAMLSIAMTACGGEASVVESAPAAQPQATDTLSAYSQSTAGESVEGSSDSVVFVVRGLRNREGRLLVLLFKDAAGFPGESSLALAEADISIDGDSVFVAFGGLQPGSYAASVVHDENNNGALDTGLFGIPKEGYGASRDARKAFAPPAFEDAAFAVPAQTAVQRITLVYGAIGSEKR